MPEPPKPDAIEREIGATPEEFRRGLRLAFPGRVHERDGVIEVSDGSAGMTITLTRLPPRVIALLTLPRLKVSLRATAGSPAEQAALLARMDLAMQRGGG